MRRKLLSGVLLCLLLVAVLTLCCGAACAETLTVSMELEYCYDKTQPMLALINGFRTSDTWYWNEDNTEKIAVSGLNALTYDYGLEKVAMQRAAEQALLFSHERPNGRKWSTLYPDTISGTGKGENIAIGYDTMESVMKAWIEETNKYSGQGHRRILLGSTYTRVGVGCVCVNGRYYWAQEFCTAASGQTTRYNWTSPIFLEARDSLLKASGEGDFRTGMTNLSASPETIRLFTGKSAAVPALSGNRFEKSSPFITLVSAPWRSNDTEVATVTGDGSQGWSVTGVAPGRTTLSFGAEYAKDGQDLTVTVVVPCMFHHRILHPMVQSTCTSAGSAEYYECEICGLLFKYNTITYTEISEPPVIARLPHKLTACDEVPATCTEDGTEAYWVCSTCGGLFSDENGENGITAPVVISAKGHKLTRHPKANATCNEAGTEAYWSCDTCGKLFSDSKGKTEIEAPTEIPMAKHSMIYHAGVSATCTETGIRRYWTCAKCGKMFDDYEGTTELTEEQVTPLEKHRLTYHSWVPATCEEAGMDGYWSCSVCEKMFADYEGTTELAELPVIPAKGHGLSYTAAVPATCSTKGTEAYWTCRTCGKLFSDGEGTNEIMEPAVLPIRDYAHQWNAPTYSWNMAAQTVTATRVCELDASHSQTEIVHFTSEVTTEPTPEKPGTVTYTAVFTLPVFETQTRQEEIAWEQLSGDDGEDSSADEGEGQPSGDGDRPADEGEGQPSGDGNGPTDGGDDRLPGDVDGDGTVDGRDVIRLMKYLAEETDPETGEIFSIHPDNADVTGDGEIDEKDLLRLVRYFAGEKVMLEPGKVTEGREYLLVRD